MAQLCRGQSRRVARLRILLLSLPLVILSCVCVKAQTLYERPVLVVDPDMHTAFAPMAAADAAGRFLVTGSYDKTVRIWSASGGKLLRTIRMPAGPGQIGRVYAVAMSPDGNIVASGGWGEGPGIVALYLFDRNTGKMTTKIGGLPGSVNALAFSADGRYLAAACDSGGLRVFDRDSNWAERFRDEAYAGESYGAAFAGDGRLATSSLDGKIRLYDRSFKLMAAQETLSGRHPFRLAFRPDGKVLAAGYADQPSPDLLDGQSLTRLPGPNAEGLDNGNLLTVAWSADGQTLFASGEYIDPTGNRPVLAWDQAGRGARRAIIARCAERDDDTAALVSLPAARLLVAKDNPCFAMLKSDGTVLWVHRPAGGDFRDQAKTFSVSADGNIIDFGFEQFGKSPLRFDLLALRLSNQWPVDHRTKPPRQAGLRIEHWINSDHPELDGKPIELDALEVSQSLAIHPDGHRFVLGADWSLYAFDVEGKELWRRAAPDTAWAVNITGDGRLVVAAFGDGTIRWHRMDDGRELLALQVLSDKKNWVAWTPEGFYGATPGACEVLRWHVNHGNDAAADAKPVCEFPKSKRADVLPLVLQKLETARVLSIDDLAAARSDVKAGTGAAVAPGAQLHILAIGVSIYGDKATNLRLKFAAKDANDVASTLLATQGSGLNKKGGLYADVKPQYLHDGEADKAGIFSALASMKANMVKGADQDLAVILFSGHGALIDDRFYLLPYDVTARTPAEIKASAISANDFHDEIAEIAKHGRVLVLLDACHSGAVTGNGSALASNGNVLLGTIAGSIAASNMSVLTSSTGNEISREDDTWNHGAFTKVLLDALGKDGDVNHDGKVWMSQLEHYVFTHVTDLTHGQQHPGMSIGFESTIFIIGQ
jgi:WD40 repeat protein